MPVTAVLIGSSPPARIATTVSEQKDSRLSGRRHPTAGGGEFLSVSTEFDPGAPGTQFGTP
jgi:hypothetical protein